MRTGSSLLHSSFAAVIELTDVTFEHQTQASTGQTTGKWVSSNYLRVGQICICAYLMNIVCNL